MLGNLQKTHVAMQEIPSFIGPPRTSPWTLESSHPERPVWPLGIPISLDWSKGKLRGNHRFPMKYDGMKIMRLSGVDFPQKQSRIPVAFENSQYGFQWDYRMIPENATDNQHWNPLEKNDAMESTAVGILFFSIACSVGVSLASGNQSAVPRNGGWWSTCCWNRKILLCRILEWIASGKRLHNYILKITILNGKIHYKLGIFNSYVSLPEGSGPCAPGKIEKATIRLFPKPTRHVSKKTSGS